MEKRKWLWKRKSSERSPGETESSGSISSLSERFSDEQDNLKASPNNDTQSPEVTSKSTARDGDVNDSIKSLTEKLSAALVNVSAKDDLVKQHAKVAEEAVAGWEKAENEVTALKKQLEAAIHQNSLLDDRVSHLDGALKECVRQLRQAREEQEEKVHEAVARKMLEWESTKSEFESQLLELKIKAEAANSESTSQIVPDLCHKLEYLEKDNASLKLELLSLSEELEVRTIERDLSTQAAETASKQNLESIKKVAKLEAECRRLKATAFKSSLLNDHKTSTASSMYVESLTDSQSDSGERLIAVELDACKMSCSEPYKCEPSCSDSWASALIAGLDQFKNEKNANRNLPSSSIEIDLMDDFLEMERLAALPETKSGTLNSKPEAVAKPSTDSESSLRAELEIMINRTAELEEKLQKMEGEKLKLEAKLQKMEGEKLDLEANLQKMEEENLELEANLQKMEAEYLELETNLQKMEGEKFELEEKLENIQVERTELEMTLTISQEKSEEFLIQLREAELRLEKLQKELSKANESKQQIESQLVHMEVEARTMASKVNLLEAEVEKERVLSAETGVKCKALEEELSEKKLEIDLQKSASSNSEPKIKQEDLDVAAGKLAECQKTIASLGKQLKSLATLEDFLIDTASIPEFSAGGSLIHRASGEPWKLHSSETFSPKRDSSSSRLASENSGPSVHKIEGRSPPSSSSSSSTSSATLNHMSSDKNRNGFAKFFSRSKDGIQLEI
ncbi:filament-like plant protein [Ricinus communis]|uniref:filament-like plant protein n=1 Tax=Ricinus communis TaxID=3988 RepID=UPI000772930C|nr:filament-like plant protein [Ricinus communis]XP_015571592.1 filament-like plant protein [Ricinus communis]XP_015571593.1 filament-like plant protein [Ricinus communis]XP_025012199.1 filament-like plant protein [Ricinus communis]XP_048226798.1 filament-like plant protein [Ricinus communis]|eukprot:XP_015571591.1 filament-like plant protein [Ricinus communis]